MAVLTDTFRGAVIFVLLVAVMLVAFKDVLFRSSGLVALTLFFDASARQSLMRAPKGSL